VSWQTGRNPTIRDENRILPKV